jgi:hypothetical protein
MALARWLIAATAAAAGHVTLPADAAPISVASTVNDQSAVHRTYYYGYGPYGVYLGYPAYGYYGDYYPRYYRYYYYGPRRYRRPSPL